MDGFSLDVIGNRVILDNLDGLELDVLAKLDGAMNAAADVGKQTAQSLARVDTGEMRDAVYVEVRDQQIILGDDSPHAIFNELGTVHMSAQPFLVPGAVAAADELKHQLEGIL